MTDLGREKACRLLLRDVLGKEGMTHLPKVWVIGNDVSITEEAAIRSQLIQRFFYGKKLKIESMNWVEAYQIHNDGQYPTPEELATVDWNFSVN